MANNPFILESYVSDELFCDREEETKLLRTHMENGRNVTLIAPRRVGKTCLIEHFFHQKDIASEYYCILIDLYATKDMGEMVQVMGKSILNALKSQSRKAADAFLACIRSLYAGVTIGDDGKPELRLGVGQVAEPQITVEEIFTYIDKADKPCIIAIDEFQTVSTYPDGKAEALLRTYVQHCHNARFIFAGSRRTMMSEMFLSPNRPFFQSTTFMNIDVLNRDVYASFAMNLFSERGKQLKKDVVENVYDRFEGITWYVQRTMNELFAETPADGTCDVSMIDTAINTILASNNFTYESILFQLPAKQKELLFAVCKAGRAEQVTSTKFIKQYHLSSTSSVQSALRGLVDKEFVSNDFGKYEIYDKFFALWLKGKIM